jgi:5S rRNA maturation endonuclease (ribonuclease M5)
MTTDTWNDVKEIYSPTEVEGVLRALGIEIRDETENDFLSFCPYHGNRDTPAFSTSKRYGYSICFNPACAEGAEERLTLEKMVRELKGLDRMSAKRFIMKHKGEGSTFAEKFDSIKLEEIELPEFPADAIEAMHKRFMEERFDAQEYMKGRGFEIGTVLDFKVGLTPKSDGPIYRPKDMIVVPAYDHRSRPVGLVGRSLEGKDFKNYGPSDKGTGFHKSKIIWNLNNARRFETVIVCESCFDAMRIHQAGYPNVVALLGGTLSAVQIELFNRHFSNIIIFTDDENETNGEMTYPRHCKKCLKQKYSMCQGHKPGRELGMKLAESLPRIRTSWATYDDQFVYANAVKDAAAMTDDEIRQCLRNKISHFDYLEWVA